MTSHRAFVGYKSQDRSRVSLVVDTLIALGYEVFWDQEIAAADVWRSRITKELAAADVVVVCWSKRTEDAGEARWLLDEADEALRLGKKLCPIQLEPCTIPMGFRQLQTFVLNDIHTLEQQLRTTLGRPAIEPPTHPQISASLAREILQMLEKSELVVEEVQPVFKESNAATTVVDSGDIDAVELDNVIEWEYSGQVRGPLFGRKPHGYGIKRYHDKGFTLKGLFDNGDFVVGARSFEDDDYGWTTFARFRGEIAQSPVTVFRVDLSKRERSTAYYIGEAAAGGPRGIGAVVDEDENQLIGQFLFNPLANDSKLHGWFAQPLDGDELRLIEYRAGEVLQEIEISQPQLERLARGAR